MGKPIDWAEFCLGAGNEGLDGSAIGHVDTVGEHVATELRRERFEAVAVDVG